MTDTVEVVTERDVSQPTLLDAIIAARAFQLAAASYVSASQANAEAAATSAADADQARRLLTQVLTSVMRTNSPISTYGAELLNAVDAATAKVVLEIPQHPAYLDDTGKVATELLPAIAVSEIYPVSNQVEMLALPAHKGDMAIRADLGQTFVLATNSPTTLADWKQMSTTTGIQSIAGLTSATISTAALKGQLAYTKADVGLGSVPNSDSTNADNLQSGTVADARLSDPVHPYGRQTIWIPAGAMIAAITNGPSSGLVTTAGGVPLSTLDFDSTTQEAAYFQVGMPKQWNEGDVTFLPVFSQATTAAGGVVFDLAGFASSDGETLDGAFGTAGTSAKTAGTANLAYKGAESAAITIGNTPAESDLVTFRVRRVPAHASDTLAQDARLHGIYLYITTNAGHD